MEASGRKASPMRTEFGRIEPIERERAIARTARRQHGVVSLAQFQACGLGASAVRNRVRAGRLRRIHQGVYAVGSFELSVAARYMAAVLACGPGAVLSHRSAADLHGLRRSDRSTVDVTVPGRSGRSRPGIQVHRPVAFEATDVTRVDGIPCTTVARTLVDVAAEIDRPGLERAVERAEILRVFDLAAVEEVLARAGRPSAAKVLRAVLESYAPEPAFTRSELEKAFLRLCRQAGVPGPHVNTFTALPGDGFEVDFTWPDRRLKIEADSRRFHGTRRAFEDDRRRDQQLTVAGWRVVRFTWRQVFREPEEVCATLGALLAA
jgi:predicted transcriptional regulator of viral defense system